MTKEQWDECEKQAMSRYRMAQLMIDGYDVSISLTHNYKNHLKLEFLIYVNKQIKGEWFVDFENPSEEAKRFYCCKTKSFLSYSKENIKIFGKKDLKKRINESKRTYYSPTFSSFKTLKSTLIKNNKSIELMQREELAL